MEISDGQVVGYGPPINPDGPEAASMIEALVKQIPSHEDRVLRMMTEDSAKIIDQRAFTRGYKAGLEAGAKCAEFSLAREPAGWPLRDPTPQEIASAIRALEVKNDT